MANVIDVTAENVIIANGLMSNASNVVSLDIFNDFMITLDRLADSLKSRDTIRIWKRVEAQWKQELVIDRAHVGAVTDLKIFE